MVKFSVYLNRHVFVLPAIRATSCTVYLASLSTMSITFDTISLKDADFGLPDLGAISIDSNPE